MAFEKDFAIGIDYGTTYSSIFYYDEPKKDLYPILDSAGELSFSSSISFSQLNKKGLIFGNAAKQPGNVESCVSEVKRIIGKKYSDIPRQLIKNFSCVIIADENDNPMLEIYDMEEGEYIRFLPEEIIGLQLLNMKKMIQKTLKTCQFGRVIATIPAAFKDKEKEAMKTAYKLAGINILNFLKEPSASIVEYMRKVNTDKVKKVIVIDIGGGTTDICCCECKNKNVTVISNGGDQFFGGADFDLILMEILKTKLTESVVTDDRFKRKKGMTIAERRKVEEQLNKLRREAEKIKIQLSTRETVEVQIDTFIKGKTEQDDLLITKDEFEDKINEEGLLDKLETCIKKVIKKSSIKKDEFDVVLLVGGSSKIPILRKKICQLFGEKKVCNQIDSLTSVSRGGAFYSFNLKNSISPIIYLEKIPENYGFDSCGVMEYIAHAGDVLPISKTKLFKTVLDYQQEVDFCLYRGKHKYIDDNEMVCSLKVVGLEKKKKGEEKFRVTCGISKTGDISITAHKLKNDEVVGQLEIQSEFIVTDEQFESMKAKVMSYMN